MMSVSLGAAKLGFGGGAVDLVIDRNQTNIGFKLFIIIITASPI
jgi:hypothetical protein